MVIFRKMEGGYLIRVGIFWRDFIIGLIKWIKNYVEIIMINKIWMFSLVIFCLIGVRIIGNFIKCDYGCFIRVLFIVFYLE